MNDLQIDALIEKIVKKVSAEINNNRIATAFPAEKEHLKKAYVILPETICPAVLEKTAACLEKLKKAYNTIAVVPNIECCNLETEKLEADHVVKRCDVKPFGEYVVIFVSASQNLIVKTALCLSDCFESKIVIDAIESGQSVYMYKEEKTCSSAPPAYRRRLSEYEREVSCYGVSFNELPKECSTNFISTRSEAAAGKKRNIITAEDVVKMRQGDKLFVYRGDIVTEVAAEVAQERDIEIVYC